MTLLYSIATTILFIIVVSILGAAVAFLLTRQRIEIKNRLSGYVEYSLVYAVAVFFMFLYQRSTSALFAVVLFVIWALSIRLCSKAGLYYRKRKAEKNNP